MPAIIKVWDNEAVDDEGKPSPGFMDMVAVNAKEAVRNDPKRYSLKSPDEADPKETVQRRPPVSVSPMEIPAKWEDLDWQPRKKLALALGAEKNCTSEIANAIIGAEIKRRGSKSAPVEPPPPNPLPEE